MSTLNKKITDLPQLPTVTGSEYFVIAYEPSPNYKVTMNQVAAYTNTSVLKVFPTFRARKSGTQSVASGSVNLLLTFNTADWNVGAAYSTGTNRFTPQVAGYYMVTATAAATPVAGTLTYWQLAVMKNGVLDLYGDYVAIAGQATVSSNVTGMVYLNGTTDYVTIGASTTTSGGAAVTVQATAESFFSAALMVPA